MRTAPTLHRLTAATALAATAALYLATPATATAARDVTATTLAELELSPMLLPPPPPGHPPRPDETEGTLRRIVIEPGGSTGWHRHDGHVQGLVLAGTLTRVLDDCSRLTSPTGSWITEDPGGDHVGLNLGPDPVVLLVTYVMPGDEPLTRDAPEHCR